MSEATIVLLVLLLVLLLTRAPIAVALGLSSFLYFYYYTTIPLTQVTERLFSALNSFILTAIPFFVLAANLMAHGGISKRIVHAINAAVGQVRGGLAVTAVVGCAFFAAISGASVAAVVAMGTLLIPAMTSAGYGRDFSTGVIATSSSLGILIPPSIPLIVYGVTTEQSIGDLFIGGIVPGAIAALLVACVAVLVARRRNLGGKAPSMTNRERIRAFREALLGLFMPAFVLGGIYQGIFTPTEAAAMAVLYALLVGMLVYREVKPSDLPKILVNSASASAMIMFIIANATLFTFVLSSERIPAEITDLFLSINLSTSVFLLIVIGLLLVLGLFIDTSSAVLITAPILLPVAINLGVHPIHFGIIMVMALEIGLITPPLGLNLFVASGISKLPPLEIARAATPTVLALLLALLLVTYTPSLTLSLVGT